MLVRLARFRAASFAELEREAARVSWEQVLAPGTAIDLRVTCRKSRLYHSGAVAERLLRGAAARVPGVRVAGSGDDEPDDAADGPAQRIVARLVRNRLTLSADSSGEALHRRGYREAVAKAPLRESLAAAVLMAAGWTPEAPLVDPLCGSGTLVLEAALMARAIPPGWRRTFAFQHWPGHDESAWRALRDQVGAGIRDGAPAPLWGSDRDPGAVRAATDNAARAGVAADVGFERLAVSDARPPAGHPEPGWLVTNPPWGARIGDEGPLRNLYARLGQVARRRFGGWTLAVLSASPRLLGHVGLPLTERLVFESGGRRVHLHVGPVPAAHADT